MKILRALEATSLAAGVVVFACTATAQTQAGDWELSLLGSYSHSWVTTVTEVDAGLNIYYGSLSLGYFASRCVEIKGGVACLGFDGDIGGSGGVSSFVVPITVGMDFHINTKSPFVPYLGIYGGGYIVGAGFGENWGGAGGAIADFHGGIKQFVAKNVAIDYRVSYEFIAMPAPVALNTVSIGVGLAFFF